MNQNLESRIKTFVDKLADYERNTYEIELWVIIGLLGTIAVISTAALGATTGAVTGRKAVTLAYLGTLEVISIVVFWLLLPSLMSLIRFLWFGHLEGAPKGRRSD